MKTKTHQLAPVAQRLSAIKIGVAVLDWKEVLRFFEGDLDVRIHRPSSPN